MEMPPKPEKRKEKVYAVFGESGHENEYVFTMPDAKEQRIPFQVLESLLDAFEEKEWEVLERGTRVEIRHRRVSGKQADEMITQVLKKVLGEQYEVVFVRK